MPKKLRKQLARLRSQVYGQPWAMHPPAFNALLELTADRESFAAVDADTVRGQLGITEDYPAQTKIVDGIAIVPLVGTLVDEVDPVGIRYFGEASYQVFERDYRAAIDNPQVKGVLILCNSPGGSAVGVSRAANTVFNGRGSKPVFAYCHKLAASACYYIAAACDRIITHEDAMIGSVGTIYVQAEQSRWLESIGIAVNVITHGDRKGDGNPYEPLSDDARAALQRMVTSYGEAFDDDVARFRGISVETVREQYGQGEAFRANHALSRGMVDAIAANFDEALAELKERAANPATAQSVATFAATTPPTIDANVTTTPTTELGLMKKQIMAALFAKNLINAAEVDDATYTATLAGFFRGNVPENEADILAGVLAAAPIAAPAATEAPAAPNATAAPAANVQAAHNLEMNEAQIANAERKRVQELQAKARTLSATGFVVSDEQLQHAIDNGTTVADASNAWTTPAATTPANEPASNSDGSEPPVRILALSSSVDTFNAAATEAVATRFRPSDTRAAAQSQATPLSQAAAGLRNTPLWAIALHDLQQRGETIDPQCQYDKRARINACSRWLSMGGQYGLPSAESGGAAHTAGDYPNLAGSIVARMLDQAIELADATYREWTARTADLPDLRPQLIVSYGGLNVLDQIGDDEKAPQLKFTEETPGWMQIGRYANKVALTAVMMANNDLDGWSQGLNALGQMVERTVNKLCLTLLTDNAALLDGNALFDDTNHGNDVTSGGGAPSNAQATIMKKRHRRQSGVGAVGRVKTPPAIALVPTEHEEAADSTFLLNAALGEVLTKNSEANSNTHRGKVRPVVEPDLEDSSTNIWYTLADPMRRRTIVHGFLEGFGDGGRRTSWYEPDEDTRYTKIEVGAAAAVAGYRGIVRNSGTA